MTDKFVNLLQAAAEVLYRIAEPPNPGASLAWDGTAYVPASSLPPRPFAPNAAKWWGTLTALAGILAGQRAMSDLQKQYLHQLLFGGMGSFNDFRLDEILLGSDAKQANQEVSELRSRLYEEFRRM